MIEQSLLMSSCDLVKMSDLDEFNGAFYDIEAHDLLEVWDAMDSGVCDSTNGIPTSSASSSFWPGSNRLSNSSATSSTTTTTPVLKDKLLTDSLVTDSPVVSNEHSYSLGRMGGNGNGCSGGAASDGDSIPESPLSLNDDMETECYPCIPMQTASNQKRQITNSLTSLVTTFKQEPLSPSEMDINVVDDDDVVKAGSRMLTRKQNPCLVRKAISTTAPSQQVKLCDVKLASNLRQTVRLSRPKHPQSLLKQPSLLLMTTTQQQPQQQLQQQNFTGNSSNTKFIVKESVPQNEYFYRSSSDWSSPAPSPASSSCSSTSAGKSLLNNNNNNNNRAPIHTTLISSQPNDGCGELILTEEEKKTLISEGYPIPTKLPLSKAEERSLKKIRRKIKNKISAQESRRKKKEFVDTLERKVEEVTTELTMYKKKCDQLQKDNAGLLEQVNRLRLMLEKKASGSNANNNNNNNVDLLQTVFKTEPEDDDDLDLD